MVFCLQMVSSKEKWEKKIWGHGNSLLVPNLRISLEAQGTGGLGVSENQSGSGGGTQTRGL